MGEGGVEAEVGAVEEGGEFGEAEGEAFGGGGAEGDMAELAAGAGGFAVEMEMSVRDGEDFGGFGEFADEIKHGGMAGESRGAEGEAEDRAEMIFELAGNGAFDGPVAGIVDARGHFVGEQAAIVLEELDGEDADILEGFQDLAGGVFGGTLNGRFEARSGRERKTKNAAAMVVFDERINGRFAVAGANGEDGKLARERHEAFEDKRNRGQFGLRFGNIFGGSKNPLAFAVVAHAAGLQHGGKADLFQGGVECIRFRDRSKLGGGDAEFLEELLFLQAILGGFESDRKRIDGDAGGEKLSGFDGDVFKFVGHELEAARESFERGLIAEVRGNALGDAAHGGFRRGIEKTEVQTERIAREGEHVAQLTAAEDADGHLPLPFLTGDESAEGSGWARTRPVCSARNFRTASRMAGCFAPRMAAARSAALTAPDLPMASAPTGMPLGICAMERSESRPLRAFDSTGTPKTGRTVFEAVMPARWAAPPAPAMMTSMPRFSAVPAYSKRRSGVRWAETTRVSCGTWSSASVLEANFMVSQSEPEPMMMPTRG